MSRCAGYHQKTVIYLRDGGECYACAEPLTFATSQVDHILAHSRGGTTAMFNLALICVPCNVSKHDRRLTPAWIARRLRSNPRFEGNPEAEARARFTTILGRLPEGYRKALLATDPPKPRPKPKRRPPERPRPAAASRVDIDARLHEITAGCVTNRHRAHA